MADVTDQASAAGVSAAPAGAASPPGPAEPAGHTATPGWYPPAAPRPRGASHTTRLLCSAVLADHGFAELVFQRLCVPSVAAIPPAPGVDLVSLARHAAYALDQRRHTHLALCGMLAALLVPIVGFAVAPEVSGLWGVVFLALLVGAKVRAVQGDLDLARRATATVDGVDVDRRLGEGLIRRDQERRLAEANTADLCVYASRRAGDPFPGLGQRVETTVLTPVGIDRPGDPDRPLGTVSAAGLLDHLRRTLPDHVRASEITDDVAAATVLYVNGTVVRHLARLLLDEADVPRRYAPPELVADTADHPSRLTRSYVRVQIVGHGGLVVTTLNVGAVVETNDLSVDLAIHALRPVHESYHVADRLPRSTGALLWKLAVRSRRGPGLLGAPAAAVRSARLRANSWKAPALTPKQRRLPGTQDFHGAAVGLREITSVNGTYDFNQRTDAVRHGQILMVGLLTELIAYLRGQNVDTSPLEEQRQAIITNNIDASQTVVTGPYVSGGAGGIAVEGDLTVGSAPNLGKKGS